MYKMDSSDLNKISSLPVFHPTVREFKNFSKCVEKYEKLCGNAGAFKVVPPKGWVARTQGYEDMDLVVRKPIEQFVHGRNGLYELVYMVRESRSLAKYQKFVSKFENTSRKLTNTDIERLFWKTLKLNAPLYGADIQGTLMDEGTPWNLGEIKTALNEGMDGMQLSGVTLPYLYFGGWKTMFGWHKEDMDLYSINFLHLGATKFWYSIDVDSNQAFEEFTRKAFSDKFEKCSEYLRHKNTLVNPVVLRNNGIKLRKMVQKPGEFIILRSKAYHSGFNSGYNIAEAVNFALFDWIKNASGKVNFCNCVGDSVKINMSEFCKTYIEKLKKKRNSQKKRMIKVLEEVLEEDIKAKEIYTLKQAYLLEKKQKALESRRKTLLRKGRKRTAQLPSKKGSKSKKVKTSE
mmetsp:Transcript_16713/g.14628  ORF Transcript_16713/g.14628 Transcript_16713/m.14628 type:complete len:403 (+) Transcript_16713:31-1239(+)